MTEAHDVSSLAVGAKASLCKALLCYIVMKMNS